MAEGEADLVGGFHTEYGAFKWGLFFVAEYAHADRLRRVHAALPRRLESAAVGAAWTDVEGWAAPRGPSRFCSACSRSASSSGRCSRFIFFFMWVRWTVPRFRYDQVMKLGWQKLLPLSIANLLFYAIASRSFRPGIENHG
jgi:NADH-quinone oxidoreductase subunit H